MNDTVTISRSEYDRLREASVDLADLQTYDRAMAALAAGLLTFEQSIFVNPRRVIRDQHRKRFPDFYKLFNALVHGFVYFFGCPFRLIL